MKLKNLLFLSLLSSAVLSLSWYFGLSFLIFFGFVPLLLIEDSLTSTPAKPKRKITLHLIYYFTFLCWNLGVTWWLVNASFGGALMAFFANALLMTIVFVVFSTIKNRMRFKTQHSIWILIPLWLAFEHVHTLWDASWPWLTLGNVFAFTNKWVQWYEFTGTSGGSFWVLVVNILVFKFIRYMQLKTFVNKHTIRIATIIIAPIILSYIILFARMNFTKGGANCVIVQPNIEPYNEKFVTSFESQFLKVLKQIEGKVNQNTKYLVLPETFIVNEINEDEINSNLDIKLFQDSIIAKYPNINIVTGASSYRFFKPNEKVSSSARFDEQNKLHYDMYNTAILINKNGCQVYHKSKLVPGPEVMPLSFIFKYIEKFALDLGGTTGTLGTQKERTNLIANNKTSIAPIVCYESIYADFTTGYTQKNADLFFIITNDGWWGSTPGHRQHLAYGTLRAIENRRQIARSANTGISCFINEFGKIEQATNYWEPAVISQIITPKNNKTFFVLFGDLISYASCVFALLIIVYGIYLKFTFKEKLILV